MTLLSTPCPQWGWRHEPPVSCESARKVHDTTQPGQWCDGQVRRTSWSEIWQQAGGLAGALKMLVSTTNKGYWGLSQPKIMGKNKNKNPDRCGKGQGYGLVSRPVQARWASEHGDRG